MCIVHTFNSRPESREYLALTFQRQQTPRARLACLPRSRFSLIKRTMSAFGTADGTYARVNLYPRHGAVFLVRREQPFLGRLPSSNRLCLVDSGDGDFDPPHTTFILSAARVGPRSLANERHSHPLLPTKIVAFRYICRSIGFRLTDVSSVLHIKNKTDPLIYIAPFLIVLSPTTQL